MKSFEETLFVAASVKLHGARPWHLEEFRRDSLCSSKRETPRRKAVASERVLRDFSRSCERETPRRKAVASTASTLHFHSLNAAFALCLEAIFGQEGQIGSIHVPEERYDSLCQSAGFPNHNWLLWYCGASKERTRSKEPAFAGFFRLP